MRRTLALAIIALLGAVSPAVAEDDMQQVGSGDPLFSDYCSFTPVSAQIAKQRGPDGRVSGTWSVPRATADLNCTDPQRSLAMRYTLVGPSGERVDPEARCSGDLAGALLGPPSAACTKVSIAPVTLRCSDCAGWWLYYRTWDLHAFERNRRSFASTPTVKCSASSGPTDSVFGTSEHCESILYFLVT